MFCDSLNDPDEARPNINICPVCMAHPGTLPVINRAAVEHVLRVGLALSGRVALATQFERKNYFYPDLPKGYQISQYALPLVQSGMLEFADAEGEVRRLRIRRVHLEEDTGRLVHDPASKATLVDFNRAGIPLMELVTEPDLGTAADARLAAQNIQRIFQYVGASEANMEKGEMRIEANVSIRPIGTDTLGTKVELKNINSFRFVEDAIRYEVVRQAGLLERGEGVVQETRGWDAQRGVTVGQRLKEGSEDYRYFPEPDLPPLTITPETIEELKRSLPELPAQKLARFRDEFKISAKLASILVQDRDVAAFFEATVSELPPWLAAAGGEKNDPRAFPLAANYLTTDVLSRLAGAPIRERLDPENFAELIAYLSAGKISSKAGKEVLAEMMAHGADPSIIIEEKGLWQISDDSTLGTLLDAVLTENKKAVDDYQAGNAGALQFLVGQVMKQMRGANPDAVQNLLREKLSKRH